MAEDPLGPAARFDLATFGEIVSDPSRVAMLLALMDGSARPATELARIAGVAGSTASSHLRRLVDGGLVAVEAAGRHRYFRLASEAVGDAIEALAALAPRRPSARGPASTAARRALTDARTCYRHLAGRLGVAWLAALEQRRFVELRDGELRLTRAGEGWFESRGSPPASWPAGKTCLDWTERQYHLGGRLGSLLTHRLFEMKWLARHAGGAHAVRTVRVTAAGSRELEREFALRLFS